MAARKKRTFNKKKKIYCLSDETIILMSTLQHDINM